MKVLPWKYKLLSIITIFLSPPLFAEDASRAYQRFSLSGAATTMQITSGKNSSLYGMQTRANSASIYFWENTRRRPIVTKLPLNGYTALTRQGSSIAASSNGVFIALQAVSVKLDPVILYSCFEDRGQRSSAFDSYQLSGSTVIQPKVIVSPNPGEFFLLLQEINSGFHLRVLRINCNSGVLASRRIESNSKGNFSPSGHSTMRSLELVYQSKDKNRVDHLVTVSLDLNNLKIKDKEIISENAADDQNAGLDRQSGVFWQTKQNGLWQIVFKDGMKKKESLLSSVTYNNVQPALGFHKNKGRVFFWVQKGNPDKLIGSWIDASQSRLKSVHEIDDGADILNPEIMQQREKFILRYEKNNRLSFLSLDDTVLKPGGSFQIKRDEMLIRFKFPESTANVHAAAYALDQNENTVPEIWNWNKSSNQISIPLLEPGKHYFHLRYEDFAGNISEPLHLPIFVDRQRPVVQGLTFEKEKGYVFEPQVVRVQATDDTGVAKYRFNYSSSQGQSQLITRSPVYEFIPEIAGDHQVSVQAIDGTGKTSSLTTSIRSIQNVQPVMVSRLRTEEEQNLFRFRLAASAVDREIQLSYLRGQRVLKKIEVNDQAQQVEINGALLPKSLLKMQLVDNQQIVVSSILDNRIFNSFRLILPEPETVKAPISPFQFIRGLAAVTVLEASIDGKPFQKINAYDLKVRLVDSVSYNHILVRSGSGKSQFMFPGKKKEKPIELNFLYPYILVLAAVILSVYYFRSRIWYTFSRVVNYA